MLKKMQTLDSGLRGTELDDLKISSLGLAPTVPERAAMGDKEPTLLPGVKPTKYKGQRGKICPKAQ